MSYKTILSKVYGVTQRSMSESSMRARETIVTDGVNAAMDFIYESLGSGEMEELGQFLEQAEVENIHPDILDAMVVALDGVDLPEKSDFEDRALLHLAETDALIRRMPLVRIEGDGSPRHGGLPRDKSGDQLVVDDVRGSARKLYKEKAAEYKRFLETEGSLDRFYKTKTTRPS